MHKVMGVKGHYSDSEWFTFITLNGMTNSVALISLCEFFEYHWALWWGERISERF